MIDLLWPFLEVIFLAVLENVSPRSIVKILVVICGCAVLREVLPFDEATSLYWSIIITSSLVALYFLFQFLRLHIKQVQSDLHSPSDAPENIN